MLFSLTTLLISLYQYLFEEQLRMRLLRLITSHYHDVSVVLRKSCAGMLVDAGSREAPPTQDLMPPECERQLWADDTIEVLAVKPQLHIDLKSWTSYLSTQNYSRSSLTEGNCHILLEVSQPADPESFLNQSLSIPPAKRIKVMDLTNPIAWKSGSPFSIVAECSPASLALLGVGLKEGRLLLDDMLELHCISTVSLEGRAMNLLRTSSQVSDTSTTTPTPSDGSQGEIRRQQSWNNILDSLHSVLEEPMEGREERLSAANSNESLASLPLPTDWDTSKTATPIHNEQLLRVKDGALAQETDSESSSMMGDTAAGEAPSDSLELLAPEVLTPAHRRQQNRSKPPNVLIYCGKKDSSRQYEACQALFSQCLNPDKYTLYHLKHEHVHNTPWRDNTVLLIIASDKVYDGVDVTFLDYFMQGGTVFSLGSVFDGLFVEKIQINKNIGILSLDYGKFKDITVICGRYVYKSCDTRLEDVMVTCLARDKQTDRPILAEASHDLSGGVALLSQIHLDKDPVEMAISPDIFSSLKKHNPQRFEILTQLLTQLGMECGGGQVANLTPCHLLSANQTAVDSLMKSLEPRLKDGLLKSRDLSLLFCNHSNQPAIQTTNDTMPVYRDISKKLETFDVDEYIRNLETKVLGQVVFYSEVVNTTMNFFEGLMFSLPSDVGVVAVATRQKAGQGRGGNSWLSPPGCAMFSLHVRVPVHSALGQRVAFIQHITSLAVVHAVTTLPGYQDIDLRLKWPNDIYFGSTMKLGGVIVKSSVMSDIIHINIGCGFNVSNQNPTVCINDLVAQHNAFHGTALGQLSIEQLIGRTVTHIEQLIELFQNKGRDAFVKLYYQKWLHSDAVVHLQAENKDVTIRGVDEYGYLSVQSLEGDTISLHDDGNSFDMMRNLIIPKTR